MATASHDQRGHSRRSPSGAKRWRNCPGSIVAAEAFPPSPPNQATADGTAMHEVAEICYPLNKSAAEYVGTTRKCQGFDVQFTAEMAEGVDTYTGYIREATKDDSIVLIEEQVDLNFVHPLIGGGTTDCAIITPSEELLEVIDLKGGAGVVVEPEENDQLMLYGAGLLHRYHNHGIRRVKLTIVQPRAFHPKGPIRSWEVDAIDLWDWVVDVRKDALATDDPSAKRAAGEWCKWCPASGTCPALRALAMETAKSDFDDEPGDFSTRRVSEMSPEEIADALHKADIIDEWLRSLRSYAFTQAERGNEIPGWKLVAKRGLRKWDADETDIALALEDAGLTGDDIFEYSIRSPAQIEKIGGKEIKAVVAQFAKAKSSGPTLVPSTDPREAVTPSAYSDFD